MDDKVYTPEVIIENPFPQGTSAVAGTTQNVSGGNYAPATTKEKTFPTKRVAVELLSTALNTRSRKILQEFELAQSGAIQIGDFKEGLTGDLRLTPNGLTARDVAGITTFAIDGTTGSAVFKGEIQAGALISGLVDVGDNSIVIDGETKRMVFYDDSRIPVILIGTA